MNTVRTNAFVFAICDEYEKAKNKHPRFADRMMHPHDFTFAPSRARTYRRFNDEITAANEPSNAAFIFHEEFWEAMAEYKDGNLSACLDELAQCGAVILRMMEFVADERDGNKKDGTNAN